MRIPVSDRIPLQKTIQLSPPPHWEAYLAYLEDRGPPPRPMVMPQNLMLQTEADERWERRAELRPSKFFCPSCKDRMSIDQVLCTKCGLDFRTGHVMGKNAKLAPKGMAYLKEVPWLIDARKSLRQEMKTEQKGKTTSKMKTKAPKRRRRR